MAKTYKAVGQQIATGLRALFAVLALSLFLLVMKRVSDQEQLLRESNNGALEEIKDRICRYGIEIS